MKKTAPVISEAQIDEAAADWVVRREEGLSAAEAAEFSAWQAADARHAAAVARHDQAWTLLDRPRTSGRAMEMTRALSARASRRRTRRLQTVGFTAVALLLIGMGWRMRTPTGDPATPASAVVLVPRSQTLPDGSTVELKTGAEIAFDYSGALRRVTLLRGEALFTVAKNAERAFVVTAAGVEVRAVGTAFMVEMGQAKVDVVVTEGSVAVEKPAERTPASETAPAPVPATMVSAGRRVTVEIAADAPTPRAVDISAGDLADRLAWRAPRLEFSETPLAEAIALMNRHAQIRLVVADAELAKLPVNGLFRADNTETLVRILEASFGVTSSRTGDTITLRKAR